jgi:hypothetical protein
MDIQSLRLLVTEADAMQIATRALGADPPVRNLRVRITAEGIHVSGDYPTLFVQVPFETVWEPSIRGGEVHVRLGRLKVVGLPVGMFRGAVMGALSRAAREPGIRVEGNVLMVDVDVFLQKRGVPVRTNLRAVECAAGQLTVEAGVVLPGAGGAKPA